MDKDLQSKYVELQLLDRQLKQVQQQLALLEQQHNELLLIKQALSDLPKLKKGADALVPVSAGIYAKAKIENTDELVVNVGSNIAVGKSVRESAAMVDDQLKDLRDAEMKLTLDMNMLVGRAQEIEKEMIELSKKENV
jgi:prefoldin alpha subunit